MQTSPNTNHRRLLAELHTHLDQAANVLGLSDAVLNTGHDLINGIPEGSAHPTSPSNVASLALRRRTTPRTIHNRIKKLIEVGLAENHCLDGGRRHVARDRHGRVTAVYGIDFTPLLERAAEFQALRHAQEAAIKEHTELRHEISRLRAILRRMVQNNSLTGAALSTWKTLPRRIAHLTLTEIRALWATVNELLACGKQSQEAEIDTDRPEETHQPYTTHQDFSLTCNLPMAAENREQAPTCGLEHINLRMMLALMPEDWQVAIERYGRADWNSFTNVAYEKAASAGISPAAWATAQAAIGRQGAAVLVLIALADACDRGGKIHNPGGWVRRMAERAELGIAQIHRSVFGLLNREEPSHAS